MKKRPPECEIRTKFTLKIAEEKYSEHLEMYPETDLTFWDFCYFLDLCPSCPYPLPHTKLLDYEGKHHESTKLQ